MFAWAAKVMIHRPFSESSDQAMMLILWYSLIFLLHMQFIATCLPLENDGRTGEG